MFFGTPAIAVPALLALGDGAEVCAVVCQPDRAAGRGLSLTPPAVKVAAERLGLEVLQPLKLKDGELARQIRERRPDVALVMAYGRILPKDVLEAPRLGCLNLHASLLPEYRGAAPIQRCLMDGRTETGMCLMQMDEGLDTGDVLTRRQIPIGPAENLEQLSARLAELAAEMTRSDLPRFLRGELSPIPQDHARATHAPPLTAADLPLHFVRSAQALHDQVRALAPKPGAECSISRAGAPSRRLRVLETRVAPEREAEADGLDQGELLLTKKQVFVKTGAGVLELLVGQAEGKKVLPASQLLQGRTLQGGDRLLAAQPT